MLQSCVQPHLDSLAFAQKHNQLSYSLAKLQIRLMSDFHYADALFVTQPVFPDRCYTQIALSTTSVSIMHAPQPL